MSASIARWHETQSSARFSTSLVSYIPMLTDFACGQFFSPLSCPSSHFSAGPWQESQLTPSAMSYFAFGVSISLVMCSAWQPVHLSDSVALAILSFWAIAADSFFVSVVYALLCLSFVAQTV